MKNGPTNHTIQTRKLSIIEFLLSLFLRLLPIKHGKHRILSRALPKGCWSTRNESVALSIHRCEVIVDPSDAVGWHIAMLRTFDPEVVEILEKACDPVIDEVFWDIGANKGACFCNLGLKLPLLKIVAIEPQKSLAKNNLFNLESICRGRYEYVRAAVGEKEDELTLFIPSEDLGQASFHLNSKELVGVSEIVKVRTASNIVKSSEFGWPTVIKIDVEGHEPQVFRSLEPCFSSKKCKVVVFENRKSATKEFDMIRSITKPHGYEVYGITKTPWATKLEPTKQQLSRVNDYALIRSDILSANKRLSKLVVR